jgi:hypothetical protein
MDLDISWTLTWQKQRRTYCLNIKISRRLEFKQNITNALAEKYFDWSVRAIFMTGVLYSYESDKFLRFDMVSFFSHSKIHP